MMKINIIWLKKDVRWHDNEVIIHAMRSSLPVMFVYIFEPSVMSCPESDVRHWRFAFQGVQDFGRKIGMNKILVMHTESIKGFQAIAMHYHINAILSHQETGLEITYRRDQEIRAWCLDNRIIWKTFERDGIRRNQGHREGWQAHWDQYMNTKVSTIDPSRLVVIEPNPELFDPEILNIPDELTETNSDFQIGGESRAMEILDSFMEGRVASYLKHLARPANSRHSCSRLSPYLAHGQISARLIYQKTHKVKSEFDKEITQFRNRLWWRSHYIQKLETEYTIEKAPINAGFDTIVKPYNQVFFDAWSKGNTGFPMIDASMRCLIKKGNLNFRMRAMLATFWSFTLWQDWKIGATHLAKIFLDFDPGIHYAQFQMQAGMTGYHPVRIFNPTLQAQKYDEDSTFIKEWVPELANVPSKLIATPWQLSMMEQTFYQVQIGQEYPKPIVNYDIATREAKAKYWDLRNSKEVREKLPNVWKKHCLPQDIINYRNQLKLDAAVITESAMYDPQSK